MGTLCQACLSELGISTSPIPLCEGCYKELLSLPLEQRMARIAAMRQNSILAEFVDRLSDALDDSARVRSYRGN